MSHSGGKIEMISLGGEAVAFEDVLWRVPDDDPKVLLRFSEGVVPDPQKPYSGDWIRSAHPDFRGNWWLWRPLGASKDTARNRRCGRNELAFIRPSECRVRLVIYSRRVLGEDEYDFMLREIEATFPGRVWDAPEQTLSRGSYRLADRIEHRDAVPVSLLREVAEELEAARRIVRRPSWELAPPRPGRPAPPSSGPARTFDVVENRIALSWARRRTRQLRACNDFITATLEALSEYIASVAEARGVVPVDTWVTEQRDHVQRLQILARDIADLLHSVRRTEADLIKLEVHSNWEMTPAVRRSPDPYRLAQAHTREEAWAEIHGARRALAPFLPTASLFELWAGLELVRLVEELGFVAEGPPTVISSAPLDGLPGIPTRAQWAFRRDRISLRVLLLPTARRFATAVALEHRWANVGLSCIDAVGVNAVEHGHRTLFVGFGEALEPDFALVLTSGTREAICVGDALFCDATRDTAPGSLREKIAKVRRTYARKIAWVDADGRLCPCVATACFAAVPHDVDRDKLNLSEEEQEIRVFVLTPCASEIARRRARAAVGEMLATLEWHLVYRPPLTLTEAGVDGIE